MEQFVFPLPRLLLYLEDNYRWDYYCAVGIVYKIVILASQNLQSKNKTEAIGTVEMAMLVA